ncbi:MAG: hypothetical protein GX453_00260 [Lactococcus chungangensis]|uniref:Uncharacterized protein n=1 Tax=Pseudolactococcus chungangensis TaxID=451457 RepID=A0A847J0H1_9LACT|nr:hypothetical protein [Lactococcus chungangensis]
MKTYEIIAHHVIRGKCNKCDGIKSYMTCEENGIYQLSCKSCGLNISAKFENWYEAMNYFWPYPFSDTQKRLMLHCLGLDYSDHAYRNYYETYDDDYCWSYLVNLGFAYRSFETVSKDGLNHFKITKCGQEFLQSQLLNTNLSAF